MVVASGGQLGRVVVAMVWRGGMLGAMECAGALEAMVASISGWRPLAAEGGARLARAPPGRA